MSYTGSRRDSRERALALLYEAEAKEKSPGAVVAALPLPPDTYAAQLVHGVELHADEIDGLISQYARGWKLERMPAIDRALLRLAVYELLAEPEVPTAAVVTEAVELASQYSTDESGRFVNGLLARIAEETRGAAGSHRVADDHADDADDADDAGDAGDAAGADDDDAAAAADTALPQ